MSALSTPACAATADGVSALAPRVSSTWPTASCNASSVARRSRCRLTSGFRARFLVAIPQLYIKREAEHGIREEAQVLGLVLQIAQLHRASRQRVIDVGPVTQHRLDEQSAPQE